MAQDTATQFLQPSAGIDVRRAAAIAAQAVRELFSQDLIKNIMLEEVEYVETLNEWRVTIGFDRPRTEAEESTRAAFHKMPDFFNVSLMERAYKEVGIDGASGTIKSVKMRRQ